MEKEQVENLIRQMFEQNEECRNLLAILANEHYRLELDINPEGIDSVTVTNRQTKRRKAGIYITFDNGREEAFIKPKTAKDAFLYVVEDYFGTERSHQLLPNMINNEKPEKHNRYKEVTDKNSVTWYIQFNRCTKDLVAAINRAFRQANLNCIAEEII